MRTSKEMAKQKLGTSGNKRTLSTTNKKPLAVSTRAPLKTKSKNIDLKLKKGINAAASKTTAAASIAKSPTANLLNGNKKRTINKNVYEYSFDADTPPPITTGEDQKELQELFKTLQKEKKITLKKYKPKINKQTVATQKTTEKNVVPRKRRNELKPVIAAVNEPLRKKPNLKINTENDTVVAVNDKKTQLLTPNKENRDDLAKFTNNNLSIDALKSIEDPSSSSASKGKMVTRSTIKKSEEDIVLSKQKEDKENAAAVKRLRKTRNKPNDQSTPKATPLAIATAKSNGRNLADYSYFSNASPLLNSTTRSVTRSELQRQRLQLSTINDGSDHDDESAPAVNLVHDDDVDDDNDFYVEPINLDRSLDKENLPNSSPVPTTPGKLRVDSDNRNNDSLFPSTSNFDSFAGFSPGKLRVYGRSPLKNITNEVNNTNAPPSPAKLELITSDSIASEGSASKSPPSNNSANPISNKLNITLPEGSFFESRTRLKDESKDTPLRELLKSCFGFISEDDEDNSDRNNDSTAMEQTEKVNKNALEVPKIVSDKLNEACVRLKRPIHPEWQSKKMRINIKKSDDNNNQDNLVTKEKTQKMFGSSSKNAQTDIRTVVKVAAAKAATAAKTATAATSTMAKERNEMKIKKTDPTGSKTANPNNPECVSSLELFKELQYVEQDKRKSYSRAAKQYRKRHVLIDLDHEDDEEKDDHDDEAEKKSSKSKRRKRLIDDKSKEEDNELETFAREFNSMCQEVDKYELVLE